MQFPVSSIIKFPFTTRKTLQPNIYIYTGKQAYFDHTITNFSILESLEGILNEESSDFQNQGFITLIWEKSSSMFWKDSTWTCQRLVEHRSSGGKWKKGEISERNKRNESLIVLHTYAGRLIKLSSPIHPQLPFK